MFIRKLLPCLLGLCLYLSLPAGVSAAPADLDGCPPALHRFIGLSRNYDVSFLWFDRLAEGHLDFVLDAVPGRYRAVLEARTLGAAAWLTGDRVQRYETLMVWSPQGRLQPIEFTSSIYKKKRGKKIVQTKFYTFDERACKVEMFRIKDGTKSAGTPLKLKGKTLPVDFLTAYFNLVSGADGPIAEGDRREMLTFGKDGEAQIVVEVLRPERWPETPFFPKGNGLLLKVSLPPEVLDTGGGAVFALLDRNGHPERGIVENVLGMGDVRGVSRR